MPKKNDLLYFSCHIESMFTAIAPRYDFLNRFLSFGQDQYWRRKAIDSLAPTVNERILDVATGTGDISLEIASRISSIKVVGLDFSRRMLDLGRNKVMTKGYKQAISFQIGNGECLPFANQCFDGAVCAFGVRNFLNIRNGLSEFYRVLKPGGRVVVLEFSKPSNSFFKFIYNLYFYHLLPRIGKFFSGHASAYNYLPKSVQDFPSQINLSRLLEEVGFKKVSFHALSLGIVSIHCGYKT